LEEKKGDRSIKTDLTVSDSRTVTELNTLAVATKAFFYQHCNETFGMLKRLENVSSAEIPSATPERIRSILLSKYVAITAVSVMVSALQDVKPCSLVAVIHDPSASRDLKLKDIMSVCLLNISLTWNVASYVPCCNKQCLRCICPDQLSEKH
jgi:hypothetical protein